MKTTPRFAAEFEAISVLMQWDSMLKWSNHNSRHVEIGSGIAANLRGTLKNPAASIPLIQSLADDLNWRIQKLNEENLFSGPAICV